MQPSLSRRCHASGGRAGGRGSPPAPASPVAAVPLRPLRRGPVPRLSPWHWAPPPSGRDLAPPPCFSRRFWDDDGSEGSGAQHGGWRRVGSDDETPESRAYRHASFTWRDWRKHRNVRGAAGESGRQGPPARAVGRGLGAAPRGRRERFARCLRAPLGTRHPPSRLVPAAPALLPPPEHHHQVAHRARPAAAGADRGVRRDG
jgi:hypothetical protein